MTTIPAFAINRVVNITAPAQAVAGTKVAVSVFASTDAGEGEQIGSFQGEYSVDNGRTWAVFCYEENMGASATRNFSFLAGPAGTTALVRVRVAFRDGVAGAVDYNGAAVRWFDTWKEWREPPAKFSTTAIVKP